GAEREAPAARIFAHDGAVVAQAALPRRERVRLSRLRVEPHDAVVERDAGRGRDAARAEGGEQRLRDRAEVALLVDHAEVRGAALLVARGLKAGAPGRLQPAREVDIAGLLHFRNVLESERERRPAGQAGRG